MKKTKKLTALLLSAIMIICCFTVQAGAAGVNPKDIVAKALKELQNAESISFSFERISNYSEEDNKPTKYRHGVIQSDNKLDYGIFIDTSESEKAWIEYDYNGKDFRKGYESTSYYTYTNSDYIAERGTCKKALEYILSHLKNLKLTSTSEKYYTITGKPGWSDSGLKKITLTISISSGQLVKYVETKAKKTYTYLNSTDTYTITGGTTTYSDICYGKMTLSLPDELKGK